MLNFGASGPPMCFEAWMPAHPAGLTELFRLTKQVSISQVFR